LAPYLILSALASLLRRNWELTLLEGVFLAYLPSITAKLWKSLPPRGKLAIIAGAFQGAVLYPMIQVVTFLAQISLGLELFGMFALQEIIGVPFFRLLNWAAPKMGAKRNSANDYMLYGLLYRIAKENLPRVRSLFGRIWGRITKKGSI
jgi:hypothetical protein